jgi:hypothetical protein
MIDSSSSDRSWVIAGFASLIVFMGVGLSWALFGTGLAVNWFAAAYAGIRPAVNAEIISRATIILFLVFILTKKLYTIRYI